MTPSGGGVVASDLGNKPSSVGTVPNVPIEGHMLVAVDAVDDTDIAIVAGDIGIQSAGQG